MSQERKGYEVDDRWLKTRQQTDGFKAELHVKTTPQVFIDGRRIGRYDDLRRHFGLTVREPGETSYRPVIAVFIVAWRSRWQRTDPVVRGSGSRSHRPLVPTQVRRAQACVPSFGAPRLDRQKT
ncbi:thioredoxin domain-containing protein [Variovorax paradoxus]|uniref:hypothetical protein n=1 Tax=Variovorax paradoxus TaxID=34073 RepID=UPI0029C70BB0|nr:hypothetical protein RZE77_20895 [Variovorax paradoxus]